MQHRSKVIFIFFFLLYLGSKGFVKAITPCAKFLLAYEEVVVLPNAFTPNGDGINDIWRPRYTDSVETMHVKIFNRFGQLLFESKEVYFEWDGKNGKGNTYPMDSYVFTAEYYYQGSVRRLQGNITLIVESQRKRRGAPRNVGQ